MFFASRVQAVNVLGSPGAPCSNVIDNNSSVCQDNQPNGPNPIFGPGGILTVAVQILAIIVGAAAVIVIIIGGLRMVVSNGDPSAVSSARNAIVFSLVGLAIAAVAQLIVAFILDKV
ncbi:MAG TPA: hypothetical protein VMR28_03195 [Candidatus Saccharimonadales bacterium]|nr:hypothetical protein [Candidatus Saccharimonadales bacterium]